MTRIRVVSINLGETTKDGILKIYSKTNKSTINSLF